MLLSLWLPILVSAAVVFVASFIAWMILPHHKADWKKLPNEDGFANALRGLNLPPGQYLFPHTQNPSEMQSDDFKRRTQQGPWGSIAVWKSWPRMGVNMLWTFVFYLVASFFIAYLATLALEPGDTFFKVFRFVSTAGIMAYCLAGIPNAIWFRRRMINDIVDGIVFALLTGLVFGLLWPGGAS